MKLGAFSVSLSVKDLNTSRSFYEQLGFTIFAGDAGKNYLILRNGDTLIGLFQGMFEGNMLTFNPGWDANAQPLEEYDDVREIQRRLREAGIQPVMAADETTSGPAHIVLKDPDGNMILLDQHR